MWPVARQKWLQAQLDEQAHIIQLDVSGRARLEAISNSPDPSGWLKAAPIPALGLSIPPDEFIIASRVWLGIPSFPVSPPCVCPCGSVIDPIGVHLLSCGHGPYRIRRHDTLRDTIYQALLLDNKEVRREQKLSGTTQERPGDIYHPDFHQGRPTFFDMAVTSPLCDTKVNNASHSAGWAAADTEARKDARYHGRVEVAGGVFIPLVVEALGILMLVRL